MLTAPLSQLTGCTNIPETFNVIVENGTGSGEYIEGDTVTIKADDPEIGEEFLKWKLTGLIVNDLTKHELTFTMPANDVTATALFEDIDYTISVLGGTADKTTAHYGEIVTVTLGEVGPGREFAFWSILEGLDPTNLDLTMPKLTFEMPACNVRLMASFNYFDYNVTIIGGTAQIDGFAEPTSSLLASYGTVVSIFANESNDKRFIRWTSENEEVVFEDETSPTTTFTMPASNVNIVAEFEQLYEIVVREGCTTNKQFAAEGEEVTVTKPSPELGYATYWVIVGIEVDWPPSTHEGTFIMPANNVFVGYGKALLNYLFRISGGTATGLKGREPFSVTNGSGGFDYNCDVTITANVPIGKTFVNWTISGIDTSGLDLTQSTLVFKMPTNAVIVTANFEYVDYTIRVEGGTADKTTAHYGDTVKIKAFTPETGKRFTGWTITGVDTSELILTDRELTFTMPAGNVTATANYDFEDYEIKVTGGTANKTTAHYGEEVTITAEVPVGKEFVMWSFDGLVPDGLTLTDKELTFTMPANAVTATANYDFEDYEIKVTGGTANKTTAHYGDSVTITANEPETGKRFTGWTITGVDTSELVLTNEELTFTMPANAVTATAVFEDIDYEVKVICRNIETKTAHYGEEVTITAENIEGKIFVRWEFTNLDTEGLDLTRAEL